MITKLQILKYGNSGDRIGVEIKDMAKNLKWVTDLSYSAGELILDIINGRDPVTPTMGAIIDFAWDSKDIFWGFVFSAECTSNTTVSIKACDSERCLRSEGSVVSQSGTLRGGYNSIRHRFDMLFHIKGQPTYRVPAEICDSKTGFDMVKSAIDKTYSATGEMYCVIVSHMYIELRGAPIPTRTLLVIDTQNTMTNYTHSEGIDNTANVVQVVQKNTDNSQTKTAATTSDTRDDPAATGFAIVFAGGNTIRTWGRVTKVVNTKNRVNWAQMVQQTDDELKKHNISERKLTLDRIGDTFLIAGAGADVKIEDFGKTWANCPTLKATHNLGTDYACSLEMKVGTKWQENSL